MVKQILAVLIMATLVAPVPINAQGARKRAPVDAALSGAVPLDSNPRVIVRYRDGAGEQLKNRYSRRGAKTRRDHKSIGAVTLQVNRSEIAALAADPDVLSVSIDARVRGEQKRTKTITPKPGMDAQALLTTLGVPAGLTGRNVGVAVIDSGVATTADLTVAAHVDFTTSGPIEMSTPTDGYGHGTHVAGLIAGNGTLSAGKYVGVAPGVKLYSFKVLDSNGEGYTSDVIEAIDLATQYPQYIQVINLSLGHPIFESPATDPLVLAVERAVAAGIVVVTSAGNHGYDKATGEIGYAGVTSPGNAPSAITVGSMATHNTTTRLDDTISKFSSRGPTWFDGRMKPDVVAPGESLIAISTTSTFLYTKEKLRADVAPYIRLSGTSMASAVTAGVVALLIEANRLDEGPDKNLTPNTIKAILQYTATAVTDPDPSTPVELEQGAGAINVAGAALLAKAIEPSAPAGEWWLEAPVTTLTQFDGVSYSWAEHIVWGDHVVWGDSIFYSTASWDEHIVWGDSVTWGNAVLGLVNPVAESFLTWSQHVVWGDHIVWGDSEHIVWGDLNTSGLLGQSDDDEHIVWGDGVVAY
jgi:serine protease AprX